jgi:hypothetical protein
MWDHVSSRDPELLLSTLHVPVSTKHDHRHCMSLDLSTYVRYFFSFLFCKCQNNRYWSSRKTFAVHEVPLCEVKAAAWCTVSSHRIIGPMFFKEADSY